MTDEWTADHDAERSDPSSRPPDPASHPADGSGETPLSEPRPTPASGAADRRHLIRYPAKAEAVVIRESDAMRLGLEARLADISPRGVGLLFRGETPEQGEAVTVHLQNDIQRVRKQTRGVVRHITPEESGEVRIGLELYSPLTPLEVSLFRMGIARGDGEAAVWV